MKHVSQTPAKSIAKGMIVLLSLLKKTAAAFLVAATVAASGTVCGVYGSAEESAGAAEASGESQGTAISDYGEYSEALSGTESGGKSIAVDLKAIAFSENVTVEESYEGYEGTAVITGENSKVGWNVTVPEAGLYYVRIGYLPLPGTNSEIQRKFLIDGKLPFEEAGEIEFGRVFGFEETEDDTSSPSTKETSGWTTAVLSDASGMFGKFAFYFSEGAHTVALESSSEPMAVSSVVLEQAEDGIPSYEEALESYRSQRITEVKGALDGGILKIQAEDASAVSSSALYATADNSSPANEPYRYDEQKINVIGGTKWQEPGAWISWEIDVPESGLYNIGCRLKQNFLRDVQCVRRLYINGKVPFAEAENLQFEYDNKWQLELAGGDEPYLFYLEKGVQTVTMEVVLGELSGSLVKATRSLDNLNNAAWRLLTLLGSEPDLYRDYNIDQYMPDVIETFAAEAEALRSVAQEWVDLTGKQDSNVAQMNQLAYQLDEMADDPDQIPALYSQFKDSLSTFANLLLDVKKQPLLLDYLFVSEAGAELPRANANLWVSFKDGVLKFISSFFNDYNNLSGGGSGNSITVWVGNGLSGGRDQALVLRRLIVGNFTPEYDTSVNLQLVPSTTILTATVAGIGPDVALQVTGSEPANYAMRDAVAELSGMPGFDEVAARFPESALTPYTYRGGVYAIPETFSYMMMFYRQDILEQLGIDINSIKTWQDVISALPTIQGQNMNISMMPNSNSYVTFLYQMNGRLYTEDEKNSALDTKTALDAFNYFMRFYTDYNLPYSYNFVTRFRTGEIVIGIEDYSNYNLLRISAPEISGKWGMTTIPGFENEDGTVNNTSSSTGAGCVLMAASKEKESGWEFMKWLTSADTQYQYGKELENVMGVGARYNTANLEAMKMLPWRTSEIEVLLEQMDATQGVPEVPGGYMTSRNVGFAIATVYSENVSTRDTLLGYIDQINQEMLLKRREFGLE